VPRKKWLHLRSQSFFDRASSRCAAKTKLSLMRSNDCLCGRYAATARYPKNLSIAPRETILAVLRFLIYPLLNTFVSS
jgi:hypothetical protein